MMGAKHSEGMRAAAVYLARQLGIDPVCEMTGIDPRTLRGWRDSAPPMDPGMDGWVAAYQLAQETLVTSLISGKVTNHTTIAAVAGISARNIRYQNLIAQQAKDITKAQSNRDAMKVFTALSQPGMDSVRMAVSRLLKDPPEELTA